jgi:anaerobic magnesium-protoporphyrin IX monomethyl ester cyclase
MRRVAFITDQLGFQEIASIPVLAAAARAAGHECALFEFGRNPQRSLQQVVDFAPDLLAYSVTSFDVDRHLEIHRTIKQHVRVPGVFGGPHPTFFPELIENEDVDIICRGEADLSFPQLLERLDSDARYDTSNFSFRLPGGKVKHNDLAPLQVALDDLPFPDRDLLYTHSVFMARNPIKVFMAGRGCPFDCSYCFNHVFNDMYRGKGPVLRSKSVDYLLREIQEVRAKYPLTFVKFHDDIFGPRKEWLSEFAERYPREIGIPFLCYARPNMVSEEYCALLRQAGCYSVSMAIECGNEELRRQVLNRRIKDEQIITACERLHAEGIRVYTLNMVGLPGETEADILRTIELNREVRSDYADASILQPYPGTRITTLCQESGYLPVNTPHFESQYSDTLLTFTPEFKQRVFVLHKLFAVMVDHPWLTRLLPLLYRLPGRRTLLNLAYRYYYGRNVHRRIFAGQIPLGLRMRGAWSLLCSRSRV